MTQPRAVIDVVAAETGAHQFLEQIRFFVGALGRAETGERGFALGVADFFQLARRQIQRFFPRRFAEIFQRMRRVHGEVGVLGHARLADQRLGQPLFMMHIVKAVTAFDAQPVMVGRSIAPIDAEILLSLTL